MNLALLHIHGNMTRDAESRFSPDGKMSVVLNVAVNGRKRQDGTEPVTYYRATAYGKLAEVMDKIKPAKGTPVLVVGSFEPRPYEANDGTQRVSYDISADHIQLLGSRDQQAPRTTDDLNSVPF